MEKIKIYFTRRQAEVMQELLELESNPTLQPIYDQIDNSLLGIERAERERASAASVR